jgi:hypothetical protein
MESSVNIQTTSGRTGGFPSRRYSDFRIDEPDEPPSAGLSLADYIVTKAKGKGRQKLNASDLEGDLAEGDISASFSNAPIVETKCPVCGEFEGDEAAVAHHVNEHFE